MDELTLAAVKTAKSSAFRFVHIVAQDWGIGHLLPEAEQVAVELVARAVETTGILDDEARWFEIQSLSTIGVRLSAEHGALLIQVRDADRASPIPEQGGPLDSHLEVVRDLSHAWDWYPTAGGKVIWARVIPRHVPPPLPRRLTRQTAFPEPHSPSAPSRDVDLAQRVLDGLRRLDLGEYSTSGPAPPH